jgi:hypothetical protein
MADNRLLRFGPPNPDEPQVAYRASMLPIGNYEDGSIAFPVWPQSAVDAGNALMRFHRGEAPQPEDAVLAGLAVAGGGLGHLGLRGSARAISGKAPAHVEASRPLTSSPVEAGSVDYTPSRAIVPHVVEPEILPSMQQQIAAAQRSEHWPSGWFEAGQGKYGRPDGPITRAEMEDATRYVQEIEANKAWQAVAYPDGVRKMGDARVAAEARAFEQNPDLWYKWRNAKIAFLEGRKGRPLTEGELMWESLDRPPTAPEATAAELMNTYGRENFMVMGHPDLEARRLARESQQNIPRLPKPDDDALFSNPKEAAPAGMLAASGQPMSDAARQALLLRAERAGADISNRYPVFYGTLENPQPRDIKRLLDNVNRYYVPEMGGNDPGLRFAFDDLGNLFVADARSVVHDEMVSGGSRFGKVPVRKGFITKDGVVQAGDDAHDPSITRRWEATAQPWLERLEADLKGYRAPGSVSGGGETLFSNAKEGAPTGLLATSSLDRMAADDAVRPRSFPDAPLTYPELEEFVRTNRGGYSSSRADQAWREDPARYDAYGRGLHDVLNPESVWFGEGPTLQSGGVVPVVGGNGETYSPELLMALQRAGYVAPGRSGNQLYDLYR